MSSRTETLATRVQEAAGAAVTRVPALPGELTFEVGAVDLIEVATVLRDTDGLQFEMLMDLCGVDYLHHGIDEWRGTGATRSGFSRGVNRADGEPGDSDDVEQSAASKTSRFAVVYHLLSIKNNQRLRLRSWCDDDDFPILPSVIDVWNSANWYEREAFDLFGILFDGHPDLRRLLTDYGFIGHPFRKDFPLTGHVEVRYDPEKRRVIYQPVTIEERTLVPKVIRADHRYEEALREDGSYRDAGVGE